MTKMYSVKLMTFSLLLMGFFLSTVSVSADSPKVPFKHAKGNKLYQDNCAICHGTAMEGSKQGPPLIHGFYKPSHHADRTFYRAALKGVQAHHWPFGDMPPVQGITKEDMDLVVPFIRWFQQEKGLY